jgi:hypothetical protein
MKILAIIFGLMTLSVVLVFYPIIKLSDYMEKDEN